MNEPTMETLALRLDRVERENRRLKFFACSMVVLVGLIALLAAKPHEDLKVLDEVRAKRFVLVDEEGKDRAILKVGDHNIARLELLDKTGELEALLTGGDPLGGGSLWLLNPGGNGFAYLASESGGGALRLHGKGGASGVGVVLNAAEEPGLVFSDIQGKARA